MAALTLAVNAYAATLPPEDYTRFLIAKYGQDLATSTHEIIVEVIRCESNFNFDAIGQDGELGLAQIFLKYHPSITPANALDPDFSTKFIVDKFRQGEEELWTCYDIVTKI
ncbi:MAG: hypothetical protein AAB456_00930 [Patescibacteria group bacterium]